MKDWQFNVLFFVGVGGAVLLLIGPDLGLKLTQNPMALTGVGTILTYVLAQKRHQMTMKEKEGEDDDREVDRHDS